MNNELIERIDAVFANRYRENNVVMGMASVPSVDYESLWLLLWDCKAALTQQQEAEPVAYWNGDYIVPSIKLLDTHRDWVFGKPWKALYAHPPKPAAQPQGWYCAHCQRGVDGSEVTYNEQHQECGRVITDDEPPAAQPVDKSRNMQGYQVDKIQEMQAPAAQPQAPDYRAVLTTIALLRKEYIGQNQNTLWESCWHEAVEQLSAAKEEGK